jgi:hypothetical protein
MTNPTADERVELTPEQALAMLPEGEIVHTFRNPDGMMLGADWGRAAVEEEIRNAERRELAGDMATRMGHGLVLFPKDAQYQRDLLFVATRKPT